MNPFISFCLYVAARVFVQYLKSKADDSAVQDALRFLLSAMNALKRRNPLTESFLVQLDVDLEVLGARIPKLRNAFPRSTETVSPNDHPFSAGAASDNPQPRTYSWEQRPGAPAAEADGTGTGSGSLAGMMPYRNECQFLRGIEDDGNPVNGPDITDPDGGGGGGVSQTASSTGLTSQSWPATDQGSSLPTRERAAAGPASYPRMHGLLPLSTPTGYEMDTSASPGSGPSNRPTPNSGSSGQQHNLAPGLHAQHSGRTSFDASPASSSHHAIPATAAQTDIDIDAAAVAAGNFFGDMSPGDSGGFGLGPDVGGTGLTPRFAMSDGGAGGGFDGWGMPGGSTALTPGAEGVLRSIMNMGPMDTMDLAWDTETGTR